MKYGHLERIEMTLRNLAPVFIGSGESLTKKEYIFSAQKQLYLSGFSKVYSVHEKQRFIG